MEEANPDIEGNHLSYVFSCGETIIEGKNLDPHKFYDLQLQAMKHTLILQSRNIVQKLESTIKKLQKKKQDHLKHYTKEIGESFTAYHKEAIEEPAILVINEAEAAIHCFNAHNAIKSCTDAWFEEFYILVDDLKYALKEVTRQLEYLNQISENQPDPDSNLLQPAAAGPSAAAAATVSN